MGSILTTFESPTDLASGWKIRERLKQIDGCHSQLAKLQREVAAGTAAPPHAGRFLAGLAAAVASWSSDTMEQQVVDLVSPRAEPRADSAAELPPSKRRRAEVVDLVDDELPVSQDHGEAACTRKETGPARVGAPKRTSQGPEPPPVHSCRLETTPGARCCGSSGGSRAPSGGGGGDWRPARRLPPLRPAAAATAAGAALPPAAAAAAAPAAPPCPARPAAALPAGGRQRFCACQAAAGVLGAPSMGAALPAAAPSPYCYSASPRCWPPQLPTCCGSPAVLPLLRSLLRFPPVGQSSWRSSHSAPTLPPGGGGPARGSGSGS